jgi:DNA-binding NtrC family response regulator
MARVRVTLGSDHLFDFQLRGGRTVVGRSDRCDCILPDDTVSRTQCIFQSGDAASWTLINKSERGTLLNGERIDGSHPLVDGDSLRAGVYTLEFSASGPTSGADVPTRIIPNAEHEQLLHATSDHYAVGMAILRFTGGPLEGQVVELASTRQPLGGPSSVVPMPGLPTDLPAAWIRVSRGRPMIEPSRYLCFLDGLPVLHLMPIHPNDDLRLGPHSFKVAYAAVERPTPGGDTLGGLVGTSPAMRKALGQIEVLAGHDEAVLIIGESGTGKELAARALHDAGPRHDGPFEALNMATLPPELFESQLFGHVKGAFTGADQDKRGAFQCASGGTLFLDEIGELRPDLQAKLLRVLESAEVRPVGGDEAEFPDVRVVAATNRDLLAMVTAGTFRRDLYFRLAVLTVYLPPLREHTEDIPAIARALLERHHPAFGITDAALAALRGYAWPGNVRELRNVLTRAVVLGRVNPIPPESIVFQPWSFEEAAGAPAPLDMRVTELAANAAERDAILQKLAETEGNRREAARRLGIPKSTLTYRMAKHGIRVTKGSTEG